MKVVRIVAAIVTVVGMALLVGAVFAYQGTREFLADSAAAQAMVMKVETSTSSGPKSRSSTHYHYRVRFATAAGDAVEVMAAQTSSSPEYQRGEIVPVLYLRRDPKVVEIEALRFIWFDFILLALLAGAALVAGLGGLWASSNPGRNPTLRVAAFFAVPPALVGLTLLALFANIVVQVIFFGFLAYVAIDVARRRKAAR